MAVFTFDSEPARSSGRFKALDFVPAKIGAGAAGAAVAKRVGRLIDDVSPGTISARAAPEGVLPAAARNRQGWPGVVSRQKQLTP